MCFNAEVSIKTFYFGLICAFISLLLGQEELIKILIVLSITSMQLLEYYTWTYIDDKNKNRIFSIIGLFIITIQLTLINYGMPNDEHKEILLTLLLIYFIAFGISDITTNNYKMEKGENGHLVWYWADVNYIWIICAFLFYLIPIYLNKTDNLFIFPFGLITLLISLYYYLKYKTWGTIWCYVSNFLWIFVIIHSLLKIYKIIK